MDLRHLNTERLTHDAAGGVYLVFHGTEQTIADLGVWDAMTLGKQGFEPVVDVLLQDCHDLLESLNNRWVGWDGVPLGAGLLMACPDGEGGCSEAGNHSFDRGGQAQRWISE
jgi:hypothetical protein